MNIVIATDKKQPANALATWRRLLPSLFAIPFRMLTKGLNGIYFVDPRAVLRGNVRCGRFTEIGPLAYLNAGKQGIEIGSYSQINPHVAVMGNVVIGNRVLIAPGTVIAAGGHNFGKGVQPRFSGGSAETRIIIGDDTWIGANATIVGEVEIGHGCVIAAGVTIDRDLAPETLVRRGGVVSHTEPLR